MRTVAVAALLSVALSCAACSGSSSHGMSGPSGSASASAGASAVSATRWWSDAAASAGSTVHPSDPSAAAGKLSPNRAGYCSLLSQTVSRTATIAADYTGSQLQTALTAWLSELEAQAPGTLAADWRTVGASMLTVIASQGRVGASLLPAGISRAEIDAASRRISTDAATACHLTLSAPAS